MSIGHHNWKSSPQPEPPALLHTAGICSKLLHAVAVAVHAIDSTDDAGCGAVVRLHRTPGYK